MVKEVFGKKIGMTQIFDEQAKLVPVTLIEVGPCTVLEVIQNAQENKVKIGYDVVSKEKQQIKPLAGYFNKLKTAYFKQIKEVEIDSETLPESGSVVDSAIFQENQKVDIIGTTKGRGFAGGMKRHGWGGQPATHGSTTHRRVGSIGACAFPGEVVKGKSMPGHYGHERRTVKNLKIVKVDKERNLIFVEGSCPGHNNSILRIRKAA